MNRTRIDPEFAQQVDRLTGTRRAWAAGQVTRLQLILSAQTDRAALDRTADSIVRHPLRVASIRDSNTDPLLLAALAGDRAMRHLAGFPALGADRGVPETSLEGLAARACREHLHLCRTDPAAARQQEARWLATRSAFRSGFLAEPIAAMEATFGAACAVAQDQALGHRSLTVPPAEWRPVGVMANLRPGLPDLRRSARETPLVSTSPQPWQSRDGSPFRGFDRLRPRFIARGGIGRAEQLARRSYLTAPVGRVVERRWLMAAIDRGPEATRQYLLRASSNPRRAAALMQMKVDPMLVAAAVGRPAMAAVLAGEPVPGGGNLGRLCDSLARADRARVDEAANPLLTDDERARILDDRFPSRGQDVQNVAYLVNETWTGRSLLRGVSTQDGSAVALPELPRQEDFQRAWDHVREARAEGRDPELDLHREALEAALAASVEEPSPYGAEDWVGDIDAGVPPDGEPYRPPQGRAHSEPAASPAAPGYEGPTDPGRAHEVRQELLGLSAAMGEGPVAARRYLEDAISSARRFNRLVEGKLDPMIVAATLGRSAMAHVMAGQRVEDGTDLGTLCNTLAGIDRRRLEGFAAAPRSAWREDVLALAYDDMAVPATRASHFVAEAWAGRSFGGGGGAVPSDGRVIPPEDVPADHDFQGRWREVREARATGRAPEYGHFREGVAAELDAPVPEPITLAVSGDADRGQAFGRPAIACVGDGRWEVQPGEDSPVATIRRAMPAPGGGAVDRDPGYTVHFRPEAGMLDPARCEEAALAAIRQVDLHARRFQVVEPVVLAPDQVAPRRVETERRVRLLPNGQGGWDVDPDTPATPVAGVSCREDGSYVVEFKPGTCCRTADPGRSEDTARLGDSVAEAVREAHGMRLEAQLRKQVGERAAAERTDSNAPPVSILVPPAVAMGARLPADAELPEIVEVGPNKWELPDDPHVASVERLADGSFRVEFRPGVDPSPADAIPPACAAAGRPVPERPAVAELSAPAGPEDHLPPDLAVSSGVAGGLPEAIAEGRAPFQDARSKGVSAAAQLVGVRDGADGFRQVATELHGASALACRTWMLSQEPQVFDESFVTAEEIALHGAAVREGAVPIRITVEEPAPVPVGVGGTGPSMADPVPDRPAATSAHDPAVDLVVEADGGEGRGRPSQTVELRADQVPSVSVHPGQEGKFVEQGPAPDGVRSWRAVDDPEVRSVDLRTDGSFAVVFHGDVDVRDETVVWAAAQVDARLHERYVAVSETGPANLTVTRVATVYHRSQLADDPASETLSKAVRLVEAPERSESVSERVTQLLAAADTHSIQRTDIRPGAGPPSAGRPRINVHRPAGMDDSEYFGSVTYAVASTALADEQRQAQARGLSHVSSPAEASLAAQMAADRVASSLRLPYAPAAPPAHEAEWKRVAADPAAVDRISRAAERVAGRLVGGVDAELRDRGDRGAPPSVEATGSRTRPVADAPAARPVPAEPAAAGRPGDQDRGGDR